MILSVNHLSKSYDGNGILKDVSFHIEANDKLAVTGINGAGKTTLLRQIVGEESPDGGTITIPKSARIGYLSQLISYDSDRTVYDEVLSVKQYLLDMEEELRVLEQKMHMASEDDAPAVSAADASGGSASGGDISSRSDSAANASGGDAHAKSAEERLEDIYSRYALLSHRFETEGGYAVRSNVAGILRGLGFSEEDYSKKMFVYSRMDLTVKLKLLLTENVQWEKMLIL